MSAFIASVDVSSELVTFLFFKDIIAAFNSAFEGSIAAVGKSSCNLPLSFFATR